MGSFAVGVDVPVSQMPAGMAFDSPAGGGGFGFRDILGALGKGALGALGNIGSVGESEGYLGSYPGASKTPFSDDTRARLQYAIQEAINDFADPKVLIN